MRHKLSDRRRAFRATRLTLVGDDMNFMGRQVSGDCTLIAHLASHHAQHGRAGRLSPDGGWRAGHHHARHHQYHHRPAAGRRRRHPVRGGASVPWAAAPITRTTPCATATAMPTGWSGNLGGGNTGSGFSARATIFTNSVSPDGIELDGGQHLHQPVATWARRSMPACSFMLASP